MSEENTKFDFEKALSELEQLVSKMETGDLSLEESLISFEQGISLTRECQEALKKAEQRIQLLTESNGSLVSEPFTASVSNESASE